MLPGDITTAAILHLSSSAPAKLQFSSTDFNSYNSVKTGHINFSGAEKAAGRRERLPPPAGPGLGVVPNWEALGRPVYVCQ